MIPSSRFAGASLLTAAFLVLSLGLSGCSGGGGGSDGGTSSGSSASTEATDLVSPPTSVETCVACHGAAGSHPVGDIQSLSDVHAVDTDPDGPLTPSGVRRLDAMIDEVDLSGTSVVIDFVVVTEAALGYDGLTSDVGRFAIVRLDAGSNGDPSEWVGIGDSSTERFTSGVFSSQGGGSYRYISSYDPTGRVLAGETIRVAIQLSGSEIPAENAWCDFDANLMTPNPCGLGTTLTRDIVQTADCNSCHGPTNETRLSFHGGGRTDVEYCVTCHNPPGNTDMTLLVHKIHAGATLANGFSGYSDVGFTNDLDDCASCHTGGGVDEDNWKTQPNQVACGSCHDDVDFMTGANHGTGGVQPTNEYCSGCHPATGSITPIRLPVETVHLGAARGIEAATYRGLGNGFDIESLDYDEATGEISVVYSVGRNGSRMDLAADPEWIDGGSLTLRLGWTTQDYENTGSGSVPAQPLSVDALDIGGAVTDLGSNRYLALLTPPSSASDTVNVHLEGRPVADLFGDGNFDERIPVASVFDIVNIEGGRAPPAEPRRSIVDSNLCAVCHDSGGAGLTFHGTNRTGEVGVCSVCHNPNATDVNQRPADPASTPDGKAEEAIDFKRMIHQIHAGENLQEALVVYGFGGRPHDYGHVSFIGNLLNCETCHVANGYSTEAARAALPSTIDTGADLADPTDDLNISSTAAVCSSCHDTDRAVTHMLQHGASFRALDEDIR